MQRQTCLVWITWTISIACFQDGLVNRGRTDPSRPHLRARILSASLRHAAMRLAKSYSPRTRKSSFLPGSGGTEFYFPALRTPGRRGDAIFFTLVWSAAVYFLYQKPAPIFFFIVFALSDLLIIASFLHVTFGSVRITVRSGEISSRTGILVLVAHGKFRFL